MLRIAVLMAIHNRIDLTLRCLDSLGDSDKIELRYFIADDGSTDGSRAEISKLGLNVRFVSGNGNWFWAKSMSMAQKAIDIDSDEIIWINNDVVLTADWKERFIASRKRYPDAILVGQFADPVNGMGTYGGYRKIARNPLKYEQIFSPSSHLQVDTFNGNFIAVPNSVTKIIGEIDGEFAHAYADCDFGLRAKKNGIASILIPGFLGICSANPSKKHSNIFSEITEHFSRKRSPIKSQIRFLSRHGTIEWPIYCITPILKIWLSSIERKFSSIPN
jgi:GT2 family glycosyltransferase